MVPLTIDSIKMHQAARQTKRAIENTDFFAEDDVPALTEKLGRVHGAMKKYSRDSFEESMSNYTRSFLE